MTSSRRPPFQPECPWCCRCCQESAQLNVAMSDRRRSVHDPARAIAQRFFAVAEGCYGGVDLEHLFD